MFYYRYTKPSYLITEVSTTPLIGEDVLIFHEKFNLDLFEVQVKNMDNGVILSYGLILKSEEQLNGYIKELDAKYVELELATSYQQVDFDYRLIKLEWGLI